ncbi:Signal transduction histidine kinase [Paenibacillus sp. UNCCL117]|uniref:sensor histidine kinase n=1 Tax=unclassified Paenibacillus TaxID=185978 RepID=UPI000882DA3B|nr:MULTISPECIES: sensor histidine kinase [unclassified Paenibacillus]SDC13989.1 Signal transduction histidine kinase [Paenibacillus sp. cl123]SFW17205.1 Signal transduction histidine kinase [Paenibacillus sp. UNCCL117]
MYRLVSVLVIVLLAWCGWPLSAAAALPPAQAGHDILDLQSWNPREDGIAALSGPWELYWNRLLEPGDFAEGPLEDALSVSIPAQWQSYAAEGLALPNFGYATYRMKLRLSGETAKQPLGLYVHNVASAYRLWINGELIGGNGTVGSDGSRMIPRTYPRTYFIVPRPGDNELVIQVSNFVQRTGGIWESIELGDAGQIASLHRDRVMVWTFLAGSLLLMAVFSVFLYLFRKKELAALWFGLICLATCLRSSLLGESFSYVLFPGLSWEWGVKLEYLSEIATIVGIAAFVNKQYPHEARWRFFRLFGIALAGFGLVVLSTPASVYTQAMVPYILLLLLPVFLYVMYVYIRAAVNRRTGSRVNMIGFIGFFASVIHEIMYYTGFVPYGGLVSFGLLFFLLTQLLNLSLMFTRAVTRSERLTLELDQVIQSQEETIRRRTSSLQELNAKLEQGNRELSRIEQTRSALLAEVHHDLSTPITSIKGFSKAIMTDVISKEEAPLYAGRIYERSQLLEKLIDSVVELSQLQTGEVQFEFVDIPLMPFLRQLSHRYEAEASARRLTLVWEEPQLPLPAAKELRARIDLFRFERVFANLIANAVKYTPAEGIIRVWAEFQPGGDPDDGLAVIHVTDNGIGIPESELPHIFKRRYQVPGVQHAPAGSGLGLAICTAIMARHDGEIGVSSEVGQGSDFFITLPVKVRTAEAGQPRFDEGGNHGHEHTAD